MDVTNGNEIHQHSVSQVSQGQISRYGETINLPLFTTQVPSNQPSTGKC